MMGVMGGHFVGMDPPECADPLVVCCGRVCRRNLGLPHPPNIAGPMKKISATAVM